MKIKLTLDGDKARWNNYCDRQVNLPPLSRFEWKYVLEETYGVKVFQIMGLDEQEQVCGILPIYEIKDYSGSPNIYSMKFGLVADNTKIADSLLDFVNQLAQKRSVTKMTIYSGYGQYELYEPSVSATTVILDIFPSEKVMWQKIRGKARNMVRKAKNDGITVEQGVSNLESFYTVYSNRMLQKSVRIHSLSYFHNIIEYMGDQTQLFIARKAGEIVGGMFLIYSGDTGAYIYGGSLVDKGTSPNQLLLWEMVCFCIENDIKFLDLGESIEGSGVHNFKIWFGGKSKNIYYYNFPCDFVNTSPLLKLFTQFRRDFLRYSSYLLLHYGAPRLKRGAGIWKRQKGPLQ
jgi:hypothetical protein